MQNTVNEITTKHNKWIATTIDKVKLLVYIQTKKHWKRQNECYKRTTEFAKKGAQLRILNQKIGLVLKTWFPLFLALPSFSFYYSSTEIVFIKKSNWCNKFSLWQKTKTKQQNQCNIKISKALSNAATL